MLEEQDLSLLLILSRCIRFASLEQLSSAFWSERREPLRAAKARLAALQKKGLVHCRSVTAIALPPLQAPITSWQPGQWLPDFGQVAWLLKRRWSQPATLCRVFCASTRAANLLGGKRLGTIPRPFHVAHDLGVAAMFFAKWRTEPNLPELWIDEDRLAPFRAGEKLPDAVLGLNPARPAHVLEFGGQYGKGRLQGFHDDCEERGLTYEIW